MGRPRAGRSDLERTYEGPELLERLLEGSGSPLSVEEVVTAMREAQAQGATANELIPQLFDSEPRFPDPSMARQLFGNLLGLWDLIASAAPLPPPKVDQAPRSKKEKPVAPPAFAPGEPGDDFVQAAATYLNVLDKRERDKLQHAFENRQDALLGHLDEQVQSDAVYAAARHLLFELFCIIELGWPAGVRGA